MINTGAFLYNKTEGEIKEVDKEVVAQFLYKMSGVWDGRFRNKPYKEIVKIGEMKNTSIKGIYFEMVTTTDYLFVVIDKTKEDVEKLLKKLKAPLKSEAKGKLNTLNELYDTIGNRWENIFTTHNSDFKIGDVKCYLNKELVMPYKDVILYMDKKIKEGLKNHPNYNGLTISGETHNCMTIKMSHKDIKGYYYGPMIKLYSFDKMEVDEVIKEAIAAFKYNDKPEKIRSQKDFIEFGEKYGWD